MFTTWEEWLDGPPIPLKQIAPLIICGPQFGVCEFTRAGMCAVQMRGLSVLENWKGLQECGLCQGIENARAVDRLIRLMGLEPAIITLARGSMTLQEFVEWAQDKKSVTLPQGLLDILQRDMPLQPFERARIPVAAAITLDELQKRWPSVSFDDFIDEIESGLFSGFPRPFGVIQKLKDPRTCEVFYQCEYIPPGVQIRERLRQQFIIGYTPPWEAHLEAERQERLDRWRGGFVYDLDSVEAYESRNVGLSLIPVDDLDMQDSTFSTDAPRRSFMVASENQWETLLDTGLLSQPDRIAAALAVEKIKGKTHTEAYDIVCPGMAVGNKAEYVSKRRTRAERLAKLHGLNMPDWKST